MPARKKIPIRALCRDLQKLQLAESDPEIHGDEKAGRRSEARTSLENLSPGYALAGDLYRRPSPFVELTGAPGTAFFPRHCWYATSMGAAMKIDE